MIRLEHIRFGYRNGHDVLCLDKSAVESNGNVLVVGPSRSCPIHCATQLAIARGLVSGTLALIEDDPSGMLHRLMEASS
jgi:hypothetical protein